MFGWGGAYHSRYWVDPEYDLVVVNLTELRPTCRIDDQAKLGSLICQSIID